MKGELENQDAMVRHTTGQETTCPDVFLPVPDSPALQVTQTQISVQRIPDSIRIQQLLAEREQTDLKPPWEEYEPPTDVNGRVILDARLEWAAGLRPRTLGERLRKNGISEVALNMLVTEMQDDSPEGLPKRERIEIAKYLLDRAYGKTIGESVSGQGGGITIVLDT